MGHAPSPENQHVVSCAPSGFLRSNDSHRSPDPHEVRGVHCLSGDVEAIVTCTTEPLTRLGSRLQPSQDRNERQLDLMKALSV